MVQLIDKDSLVAEIEKEKLSCKCIAEYANAKYAQGRIDEIRKVISIINTLEVKEVDLGEDVKEALAQVYIDYTFKRHNIDPDSKEGQLIYYAYIHGINACLKELRAQKG